MNMAIPTSRKIGNSWQGFPRITWQPGRAYPPILIATSRRDDRAHPGHARKMAAKLRAMGYEAHFYELATGGHSYGKDHDDMAAFISLGYAFLRQAIGWSPN
jgi:prolyl oligopeptidase